MLESGDLQCPDGSDDIPYCPSGCSICDTCLTLLGCAQTRPENPVRLMFSLNFMWYILAAGAGIALGIIAMTIHKKTTQNRLQNNGRPSDEPFLGETDRAEAADKVWLAPVT